MQSGNDEKFADLALKRGLLDPAQIVECRTAAQAATAAGVPTSIAEVAVKKGFLTKAQAESLTRSLSAPAAAKQIGNYRILNRIGTGAMGTVYKALQVNMDRVVALKVLPPRLARNKSFIDRFYREAQSAGKLNHVNIVAAYEVNQADGYHYFAMEYVDGEDLSSILKREKKLPVERSLDIVLHIARALDFAWREVKLVHRDVKPANILLTSKGEAKLADLGLAKAVRADDAGLTQDGTTLGTPHYISPEQARGDRDVDTRSDIYSLGATLYHMVTGQTPFEGDSAGVVIAKHLTEQLPDPQEVNPDLSDGVCHIIEKMMAKDPEDRYADMAELQQDIELVIAGQAPASMALDPMKSSVGRRSVRADRIGRGGAAYGTRSRRGGTGRHGRHASTGVPHAGILIGAIALIILVIVVAAWMNTGSNKPAHPVSPVAQPGRGKTSGSVPGPAPETVGEDAGRSQLLAALDYMRQHSDDYTECMERLKQVVDQYKGTASSDRAARNLAAVQQAWQEAALNEVKQLTIASREAFGRREYRASVGILDHLPAGLQHPDALKKLQETREATMQRLSKPVEDAANAVAAIERGQEKNTDSCKALLDDLAQVPGLTRARELLSRLDKVIESRRQAENAGDDSPDGEHPEQKPPTEKQPKAPPEKYRELRAVVAEALRQGHVKDAQAAAKKAMDDPVMRDLPGIKGIPPSIDLAVQMEQDAISNLPSLVGKTLKFGGISAKVTRTGTDRVYFQSGPVEGAKKFTELDEGIRLDLALGKIPVNSGEYYRRRATQFYFAGDVAGAEKEFHKARDAGIDTGAMIAFIESEDAARNSSRKEQAAHEALAALKQMKEKGDWKGLMKGMAAFQEQFGQSDLARSASDEIADLTKAVQAIAVEIQFWTMPNGNTFRSGLCRARGPEHPAVKWVFGEEDGVSPATLSPDGTAYVCWRAQLHAIDRDGRSRWTFGVGWGANDIVVDSEPGHIYVTSREKRKIFALSPQQGEQKWQYHVGRHIVSLSLNQSGPVLTAERPACVMGLARGDGKVLWTKELGEGPCRGPTIVTDGTMYVSAGPILYALIGEGTELWKTQFQGQICSNPSVGPDGTIYVSTENRAIYAISPKGEQIWKFEGGDRCTTPCVGRDGSIYAGSPDGNLYAISKTGEQKWALRMNGAVAAPFVDGREIVYAGSDDGKIYAIKQDAEKAWVIGTRNAAGVSSLTMGHDGTIYAATNRGLYAIGNEK